MEERPLNVIKEPYQENKNIILKTSQILKILKIYQDRKSFPLKTVI